MTVLNPVQSFVNMTGAWQQSMKNEANKKNTSQMLADSKNFYQKSLDSTNEKLKTSNLSASNLNNLAGAILTYAEANGKYDEYANLQPSGMVFKFLEKNPGRGYDKYINMYTGGQMGLDEVTRLIGINNPIYTEGSINPLNIPAEDYSDFNPALLSSFDYEGADYSSPEETKKESNTRNNIIQSILDIPLNLGKMPYNLIDKGTAWVAKQLSDDDEAIDQKLQENLQRTEDFLTLPGVNREDLSYQIPNVVTDLGVTALSSFIPGVGEAKWAEWATKFPKLSKLIKAAGGVDKLIEKYPKLAPFLKGGTIGAKDTIVMNALEGEGTTPLEALEGVLAGGVAEKGIQGFKGLSAFIQTNGLLTPTTARNIVTKLKDIGNKAPGKGTLKDLADFMTKHGLNGTKKQIVKKAEQLGADKKKILDELLSKSTSTHDLPESDEALELLIKGLKGNKTSPTLHNKGTIEKLEKILSKKGKYKLSDLEEIKMAIDSELKLFGKNGTALDNKDAKNWLEARKTIQLYIEDIAKKEGLGDVSMLNNEIQTAYAIADGVSEKTITDSVKGIGDALWEFSAPAGGVLLGYDAIKDFMDGDIEGAIKSGLFLAMLNSSFLKTHLGSLLNRMTGASKYEVQQWIDSKGREALSDSASKELGDIIRKDSDLLNQIKEFGKQYLTQLPKESIMVGGQKALESGVDNLVE